MACSAHEARVVCADDPNLAGFDWLRTFEVSRVLHSVVDPEALRSRSLIDRAWRQRNPRELRDAVVGSLVGRPKLWIDEDIRRASQVAQIPRELGCLLGHLPALDLDIEYALEIDSGSATRLKTTLSPPRLARPNALYRTHGASRFLTVRLGARLAANCRSPLPRHNPSRALVNDFLARPLRIANRVFHLFLRKEAVVMMVDLQCEPGEPVWPLLAQFMNGILDIELNQHLSVAKWLARSSLVLSATIPSIDFKPENIRRIPDIFSNSLVISHQQMNFIADSLGLNYLPSAIEGQIQARKPFVWRLGTIQDDLKIQLWSDQIKGCKTTVYIKFMAYRYDFISQLFKKEQEYVSIGLDRCEVLEGLSAEEEAVVMTDGAAAISRTAALRICSVKGQIPTILPSAYQGRIGFAKGLWYLDTNYDEMMIDRTCWIEIRDSQWKANPQPGFKFHFNLCRHSVPVHHPGSLGKQYLPVFVSRGVPLSSLKELIHEAIQAIKDAFSNSSNPLELSKSMTTHTSLLNQRQTNLRHQAGFLHHPTENRDSIGFGSLSIKDSTLDQLDPLSLAPMSFEEELDELLCAGFSIDNRQVVEKLRTVQEAKLTRMLGFKIPVTQSAYLYVIPDPTGTLKENEAFLQFSSFRDPLTGLRFANLICTALVSRSPCVAPIDVQRINLVANESLKRTCFDVLVCSIHGERALLSLLSGGDYDGDQVIVTWDQRLAIPFQNANPNTYIEPQESEWFDNGLAYTVGDRFLEPFRLNSKVFVERAHQVILAELFTPSSHSAYALRHSVCDYILGPENPLTFLVGWIYVKCLDAPKNGLLLRPKKDEEIKALLKGHFVRLDIQSKDELPIPSFLKDEYPDKVPFKHPPEKSVYVLDVLRDTLLHARTQFRTQSRQKENDMKFHDDSDLSDFFLSQKSIFEQPFNKKGKDGMGGWEIRGVWIGVLRKIQRQVADSKVMYLAALERSKADRSNKQSIQDQVGYVPENSNIMYFETKKCLNKFHRELSWKAAYDEDEEECDELLDVSAKDRQVFRKAKKAYLDGLQADGYALLKASCASCLSAAWESFPYVMAFREICYLKCQATAGRHRRHYEPVSQKGVNIQLERGPAPTLETKSSLASVVRWSIATREF